MSINLFSQAYLINTNYCIVSNHTYLIVNGHLNNQSSGNLYLTGTNSNVIIQNNITNNGTINSSGKIDLYGDWINNSTYTQNNTSYVYLKGANQNIGGSTTTTFYNLYLQGTGVKTLGNNQNVDGTLNLNDRELATQNYTMTINNTTAGAIQRTTGFVSSTVGGGLARATNSTSTYLYPVGVSGKYRPADITPSSTSSATFKVRMANGDASGEGYNRNNKAADVCDVNSSFFHIMQRTSGSINANIKVYYDNSTDGSWDKVGNWNGSLWNNYTGSSTSSGSPLYYGSANNVSLSSSTPIALTKNAPVLTVSASTNPICNGASTVLTASGANTYSWSHSLGTGNTKTVTPTSSTTYTVTGTLANGCSSTTSISVTVNPLPSVTASASPAAICNGASSVLTASGANTYSWNTGGNTASITVTPSSTTTYTVTGTNTAGCTGTATVSVTVNPLPTVTATASPAAICNGQTSVITASGANTYSWSGGLGTGASKTITPSSTTTYTVTGTSAAGCTGTATVSVTVNSLPTVTATASPAAICNGATSVLTASGANTYSWSGGLGSGASKTVTPSATTTYTVTGTSTAGCSGTATVSVTVNPLPTVTATASPAAICNGATSVLTASGANTYSWNTGGNTASITVTPSGTTTYTVTGTTAAGCSGTATVSVTVNSLPIVTATASPAAICNGSTSVLTASGANTYSWNTGGSTASITVTPSVTTIYTVTGTTNEGCTGTASVTVNVSNPPIIDYTTTQSHCGHSDGNIMTNVTGGIPPYIYQWSNGAISPNLNNISSGSYILTVNDNNGCSSSISITVTEAPKPQANFAPKPQITTIDDPIIYFENYSIDASSYEWDFGDGYNSSEFSPIHTYQNAGEYHILLSAIDQYGCIDTAGANVIIQEFNTYYVPNAFTPNRNELNESFNIFGSGINPNTFEMRIFDRWGKEIFFTKDINQGWDGTFKGEIVPAGIYTYIIKFEDSQGYRKNVITGKVILAK